MAGRTFLMDGQAMSNEEQYSSDDNDNNDNEQEEDEEEGEMDYLHYGSDQQQQQQQQQQQYHEYGYEEEEDEEEFDTQMEESVPVMPTGFYSEVDNFLSRPPPGAAVRNTKAGGKKKKSSGEEQGKKGSSSSISSGGGGNKSLPVINDLPKMNVQSKVSSHRTGAKKPTHKVFDERLLQQAFEYSNKLQQEAMVEEVYEASIQHMHPLPQKSRSAPQSRPQQEHQGGGRGAGGGEEGGGYSERKPRSADSDYNFQQNASSSSSSQHSGQQQKKKPANSVVRRLRSKTQTSVNKGGKPPSGKAKSGGFDTSTDVESATSTRNITDFQSLVSNFEQGTHLQHLREELEKSKASMADSRRAMQDISKEMSGKLRI